MYTSTLTEVINGHALENRHEDGGDCEACNEYMAAKKNSPEVDNGENPVHKEDSVGVDQSGARKEEIPPRAIHGDLDHRHGNIVQEFESV